MPCIGKFLSFYHIGLARLPHDLTAGQARVSSDWKGEWRHFFGEGRNERGREGGKANRAAAATPTAVLCSVSSKGGTPSWLAE